MRNNRSTAPPKGDDISLEPPPDRARSAAPSHRYAGLLLGFILLLCASPLWAVEKEPQDGAPSGEKILLVRATMCERIREYAPATPAVVFSASLKKVFCFTEFDPVPKKGFIYHRWYHRDRLSTTKKLFVKPPRWATASSIQPRGTDKGPWRVEVTAADGTIYHILRFSIAD